MLFNNIQKLFFQFVSLQIEYNIIRYQRDDGDECRQAFVQPKAKAYEKYGQKQKNRDEIGQNRRLVALPDGHFHIHFLVQREVLTFGSWHGEDFLCLFAHAAGAFGVASCTRALRQYLDFQFVIRDFRDDALVGDGVAFVIHNAAKIGFLSAHCNKTRIFAP